MNHRFVISLRVLLLVAVALIGGRGYVSCQNLNDKLMNRPYADLRRWHLGFSVGLHTQDLTFTHNGFTTESGEQWFVEQPAFQPGFCVNGLIDYRLGTYFNLRFTPGMYFGNRDVKMREYNTGAELRQNLKSALIVLPVDLKFSGLRYRNSRPYVTVGGDFYLPYFKLNPEIKFCFGLTDVLDHERTDILEEPEKFKITQSLKKAVSRMVVLTFYFE